MNKDFANEDVEYVMREYGAEAYATVVDEQELIPEYKHLLYAVYIGNLELTYYLLRERNLDPNGGDMGEIRAIDHLLETYNPHTHFDFEIARLLFEYGGKYYLDNLSHIPDPTDREEFERLSSFYYNKRVQPLR